MISHMLYTHVHIVCAHVRACLANSSDIFTGVLCDGGVSECIRIEYAASECLCVCVCVSSETKMSAPRTARHILDTHTLTHTMTPARSARELNGKVIFTIIMRECEWLL